MPDDDLNGRNRDVPGRNQKHNFMVVELKNGTVIEFVYEITFSDDGTEIIIDDYGSKNQVFKITDVFQILTHRSTV